MKDLFVISYSGDEFLVMSHSVEEWSVLFESMEAAQEYMGSERALMDRDAFVLGGEIQEFPPMPSGPGENSLLG